MITAVRLRSRSAAPRNSQANSYFRTSNDNAADKDLTCAISLAREEDDLLAFKYRINMRVNHCLEISSYRWKCFEIGGIFVNYSSKFCSQDFHILETHQNC